MLSSGASELHFCSSVLPSVVGPVGIAHIHLLVADLTSPITVVTPLSPICPKLYGGITCRKQSAWASFLPSLFERESLRLSQPTKTRPSLLTHRSNMPIVTELTSKLDIAGIDRTFPAFVPD